jgi:MFS family permease
VPYTLISPFIGVFIDRFARRRVMWWASWIVAAIVTVVAVVVLIPLGSQSSEGKTAATIGLIVALIAAQAVARIALAVKSAALPDVSVGKDLLQGNGLSQAGGAIAQLGGSSSASRLGGLTRSWVGVVAGAGILAICAIVALQMRTSRPPGTRRRSRRSSGRSSATSSRASRRSPARAGRDRPDSRSR